MQFLQSALDRMEANLQSLIEGSLARLFPAQQRPSELARQLIAAMRTSVQPGPTGGLAAPNRFTIFLSPHQAVAWNENPSLITELEVSLRQAGNESGVYFLSEPVIYIRSDADLPEDRPGVVAEFSLEHFDKTHTLPSNPFEHQNRSSAGNAFLIIDGTRIFPLTTPVINMGRREDNHLVIEDLRVSRLHAQLRLFKGRYMIFDLESTGGTYVNDLRITHCFLYPGDVISLAGVPIVFGQDYPETGSGTQRLDTDRLESEPPPETS